MQNNPFEAMAFGSFDTKSNSWFKQDEIAFQGDAIKKLCHNLGKFT